MQYGIKSLFFVMAVVPPVLFVAFLFAQAHPALAVLPVAWCAAFLAAMRLPKTDSSSGLTVAEMLLILAIVVLAGVLVFPQIDMGYRD